MNVLVANLCFKELRFTSRGWVSYFEKSELRSVEKEIQMQTHPPNVKPDGKLTNLRVTVHDKCSNGMHLNKLALVLLTDP